MAAGRRCSQLSSAATLALVTGHWLAIEAAIAERGPGPWMVALTRHGLRELDLR